MSKKFIVLNNSNLECITQKACHKPQPTVFLERVLLLFMQKIRNN